MCVIGQRCNRPPKTAVGLCFVIRLAGLYEAIVPAGIRALAGGLGPELAEILQLLERHGLHAREMQQRVDQHRAVAGREHEAVAVGPGDVGRIELEMARPQHGGRVGHAHRHAGMAGIGALDRVHGQGPDGVRHRGERVEIEGMGHGAGPPGQAARVCGIRPGPATAYRPSRAIRSRVAGSKALTSPVAMSRASCLPSSTPHWSNGLSR